MSKRNEYVDYLLELMAPLGRMTARQMFGGFGLYCNGAFFAIVVNDVLYLKTDEVNCAIFEAADMEAFAYDMKGERVVTRYYRCPEEALENAGLMAEWARSGIGAALRAQAGKRKPLPSKKATKKPATPKVKKPKRNKPKA
jgi:DNA transformation protein